MALSLLTMTTDNLQHVENHMLLLGRKNSRERVAAFLLEMNGRLTAAGVIALPMKRRVLQTISALPSRRWHVHFLIFSEKVT